MDSDFDNVFNGLRGMISDFNCGSFTSNDIAPPKSRHIFTSVLF